MSLWYSGSIRGQNITNLGTDFWIAFPLNNAGGGTVQLFISSEFSTSGNVTSAYPGVNQPFTVTPGIVTQLNLPTGVQLSGGMEAKGIRITSADPIAVYGLVYQVATTDAFMALPVPALGLDYTIMSYKVSVQPSCFSIVATQNGTNLTIYNHQTSVTSNITLDQGQTYHITAPGVGEDLTGSRVQSDHPVAVFGANNLANVPVGCTFADYIVEQMFPFNSWGKNYVTVPLAGRDNSGDVFRILAAVDGTDVTINGVWVTGLNTGDYYETNLTGYNSISTTEPVMVAQFAKGKTCTGNTTGDPFMMLIFPQEQFLTDYTIVNLTNFDSHWVNVVAPGYALGTIYQDGVLIPAGAFTQIGTTNFYGAQRSVTVGSHTFNSTFPFGVFVYGWTNVNSYGYPGGGSLSPVGVVDSVSISPDTLYGQLNITNVCLTAHVLDNLDNPVEGILVNFYISGVSTIVGNAYTNSSGDAQYCYMQTGTTPGVDEVYAEVFGFISDTAIVYWSYIPPCVDPASGGTIGNDQNGCGNFLPSPLINIVLPAGQTGTLEYKWQYSITGASGGFIDIPGSNADSYAPLTLTQTTWFRRLARVSCSPDWSGAAISNVVEVEVFPLVPVNVSISSSANNICQGTSVTYTATPVNGGSNPSYQWKVNGMIAGSNSSVFSYIPSNGDNIHCVLTSSIATCTVNNPAVSNTITMTVNQNLPVSVAVAASQNPVCAGTTVNFTATPFNGGTAPFYQWKVNGANTGGNNPVFNYIPVNGDQVRCVLTSSEMCTSGNPASSNQVQMIVNAYLAVSVSVSASSNPFCPGSAVTYTASPVNGGISPSYQWKVNGTNAGTNNPVYINNPVNGDLVWCVLTSSYMCTTGNPASSNQVLMTENLNFPAGVTITTSSNPFCPGTAVIYTTTPVNGGTSPSYQWKVNGVNQGTNSPSFPFSPQAGDSIRVVMTSNHPCVSFNPATSGKIVMVANPVPDVTFTRCFDSITILNAKPIKLKGGIPLGGTYSGPGVNPGTGIFTPSAAGTGVKSLLYSYTNMFSCSASKSLTIVVQPASFTCGNNLTDIRDGRVYPTVKIASQCWMAADLNYGQQISPSLHQRDNCIPEKYFNPASGIQHPASVYQWDELMQYQVTPGLQGLCPPGWHVPTETEWNVLFANWTNNGFAGSPLKYSGYSGYNALLSGVRHMNVQWNWNDFAILFWSSTPYYDQKAWSHGMNDFDPSVSTYASLRSNAFSVRCLKDNP